MSDSTATRLAEKPAKPHADFPLFPHATRRWAKKVRGKIHYFGPWEDPDGALAEWRRVKDDLLNGRKPRLQVEGVTVRQVVNAFLTAKTRAMSTGELSPRSFADYHATCERIVSAFGADRVVIDLRADDFAEYRERVAAPMAGAKRITAKARLCDLGPVALSNEVQRVRSVFKYAFDADMIAAPMKFGPEFRKPSAKTRRKERVDRGAKWLEADEIRALIDTANIPLRAMILLGVNCGLGNQDIADLDRSHLDLDRGILSMARGKTGIDRRAVLWPETVAELRRVLAWGDETLKTGEGRGLKRYRPLDKADAVAVFLTKQGHRYKRVELAGDALVGERVRRRETDSVGLEFGKMLRKVNIRRDGKATDLKRPGVNFYTLRHVFQTIAEETGDFPAVKRIMGHDDDGISAHYREWQRDEANGDARLRRVSDHVRAWLQVEKLKTASK